MTQIPEGDHSIAALIDKHHESLRDDPRPHLGCSQLGHPCDRWLWLSFRWAIRQHFPGRVLRLFRRGQLEEATIIADLRAIGIDIRTGEQQTRVDFGAHVSGSIDAIIEGGVPEAPKKQHIAEFKTHNRKSFDKLVQKGVEAANFQHFIQMQLYMHGTKIDRALYVAVCKDDDRLYTERVEYDDCVAKNVVARGRRIALSDRMPPPISTDPSWYQCKFCPAREFCHETKQTTQINCRTCTHSTAQEDSTWRCERHNADKIPVPFQREGCESHTLHPDLVPWKQRDGIDQWTAVYVIDGKQVANGEPRPGIYSSREILANPSLCAITDSQVEALRSEFGGRVEG